jgi:fatty acid desaturase
MDEFLPYEEARKRYPPPDWWEPQIDRAVFKDILKRNNYRAFISHVLYFGLMVVVGYIAAATYEKTYWSILVFFVYGTLFGMVNSRVHESLHGTPFKTQFLNEIVYFIGSCMELRGTLVTRWSHMIHHSYTSLRKSDTEIQALPPVKVWKIVLDFFYLYSTYFLLKTMILHTLGIPTRVARRVVPKDQLWKVFWSDRATLAVHAAVIILAVVLHSWLPILLFTLPRLYGGWLIWALILAQHSGLAIDVLDHRLSTRTIRLNFFLSFLYMHMEYHTEHHLYPNIPFHALARFRKAIDSQMPLVNNGLLGAYREIVPALRRQRHDADYCIKRELPEDHVASKGGQT